MQRVFTCVYCHYYYCVISQRMASSGSSRFRANPRDTGLAFPASSVPVLSMALKRAEIILFHSAPRSQLSFNNRLLLNVPGGPSEASQAIRPGASAKD